MLAKLDGAIKLSNDEIKRQRAQIAALQKEIDGRDEKIGEMSGEYKDLWQKHCATNTANQDLQHTCQELEARAGEAEAQTSETRGYLEECETKLKETAEQLETWK